MIHDGYMDLFLAAEEKSRRWGLNLDRPPLTGQSGPPKASGHALTALPIIGRAVNSYPYRHEEIRVQCAAIHLSLLDDPRFDLDFELTIGDVEFDGRLEYGTDYRRLRQEVRGVHRDSEEPIPCHVWLTFPDMHIVDATFFPYRYPNELPSPWTWSEYLVCSDPQHEFSQRLPLRYVPMLVGRTAVQALVY
jgi:hypothetical protein